jgi:hypothetical protein
MSQLIKLLLTIGFADFILFLRVEKFSVIMNILCRCYNLIVDFGTPYLQYLIIIGMVAFMRRLVSCVIICEIHWL